MRTVKKVLAAGVLAAATVGLHASAGADQIGVASAVSDQVMGTLGAQSVSLHTGDPVYHNQVLISDGSGSAQFLFVDETIFNIGPNSEVTLDEFVYNPNQGTGEVLLNVGQGAFRFITGSAAPESYTIRTPTATIGLRGTIFKGIVDSALTILELIQGKLYICPTEGTVEGQGVNDNTRREDECELVDQPGFYYVGLDADGAASGGPGDPDDPDDPNDPIDNTEDPFEQDMPMYDSFMLLDVIPNECVEC